MNLVPLPKPSSSGFPGNLFQLVVFAGFLCFLKRKGSEKKNKEEEILYRHLDQHLNTVFLKLAEDNQSVDQENTGS